MALQAAGMRETDPVLRYGAYVAELARREFSVASEHSLLDGPFR
jgi:hypothetical protein